jgi:hypothetical protein
MNFEMKFDLAYMRIVRVTVWSVYQIHYDVPEKSVKLQNFTLHYKTQNER